MSVEPLPIVVGGRVATQHVVGRDELARDIRTWLDAGESLLLTGERRIGKTCLVELVLSQLPEDWARVYIDAERCDSLESLVTALVERLQQVTGVRRLAKQLLRLLALWRASPVPPDDRAWEQRLGEAVRAVLASHPVVVMAIDELPTVVRTVAERDDRAAAHLLRLLRASREEHPRACLHLFSGSVGFHHVLAGNAEVAAAVNNLRKVPVQALGPTWAVVLASRLLTGIGVDVERAQPLAVAVAELADGVPYYEHHLADLVQRAWARGPLPGPVELRALRDEALRAPDDPWHMQHYVDRIDGNFGPHAATARDVLDVLSAEPHGMETAALVAVLQQRAAPDAAPAVDGETVRGVISRLGLDHYLSVRDGRARFVYEVVRLGWRARRQLWP